MHPIVMSVIAADKTAELIENPRSRPRAGRLRRLRIARRASRIAHPS